MKGRIGQLAKNFNLSLGYLLEHHLSFVFCFERAQLSIENFQHISLLT
jgi:hypothetical protein